MPEKTSAVVPCTRAVPLRRRSGGAQVWPAGPWETVSGAPTGVQPPSATARGGLQVRDQSTVADPSASPGLLSLRSV